MLEKIFLLIFSGVLVAEVVFYWYEGSCQRLLFNENDVILRGLASQGSQAGCYNTALLLLLYQSADKPSFQSFD